MKPTKKLVFCALLAGIGVVILLLSSAYPPMAPGLAAMAGLIGAIAVLHCGLAWSAGVYVVCAALSMLLLPHKGAAVLYALFFGWYPIAKSLLERISNQVLCWACKIALAAAGLTAAYFLYYRLFVNDAVFEWSTYAIAAVLCLLVFVAYDIAFSALISFYCRRIKPHIKV